MLIQIPWGTEVAGSALGSLGWGLRFCISNKLLAATLGTAGFWTRLAPSPSPLARCSVVRRIFCRYNWYNLLHWVYRRKTGPLPPNGRRRSLCGSALLAQQPAQVGPPGSSGQENSALRTAPPLLLLVFNTLPLCRSLQGPCRGSQEGK